MNSNSCSLIFFDEGINNRIPWTSLWSLALVSRERFITRLCLYLNKSLSENPCGSQSHDGELQVQEAQVVANFLVPADQQSPGAVEPRMSPFDFPPPRFAATPLRFPFFVGLARHMRRVAAFANHAIDRFASIAFVEAQMLRLVRSRLGSLDRDRIQRRGRQLLVRHIGAVHGDRQRHAATVDQRRTFDVELAPIRRVFPGSPPQRRLGHRPVQTLPLPVDPFQLIVFLPERVPRGPRTRRLALTPGNTHESSCRNRIVGASPSIGSRWRGRTGFPPRLIAWVTADGPLCRIVCKSGSPIRSVPITPRESRETLTPNRRSWTHLRVELRKTLPQQAHAVPMLSRRFSDRL